MKDTLLAKALAAKRESKQIEFKESFDVASKQDWCEVIKDVIAIANSGGGIILFGLNNRGEPTGTDLSALLAVDPATIADRIHPELGDRPRYICLCDAAGALLVSIYRGLSPNSLLIP